MKLKRSQGKEEMLMLKKGIKLQGWSKRIQNKETESGISENYEER